MPGRLKVWNAVSGTWDFVGYGDVGPVELASASITAAVAVAGTTEAAATTILTAPSVTLDGVTPVEVEFQAPGVITPNTAGSNVLIYLFMDGVSLGRIAGFQTPAALILLAPAYVSYRMTPASGAHVFSIRASCSVAAGGVSVQAGPGGAGQIVPAYIRVRKGS